MANTVDIHIRAHTEEASRKINGFLENLTQGLTQGLGQGLTNRLLDQFNRIPQALENAVKRGVDFNRTLEDSRLGIAAIIAQFNQSITFDQALVDADEALEALTRKAAKSPATLKELIGAFQGITGAATSASISLNNQVELVVLMSQALAGLGIRSEQILQESRALITGNITEDAMAARILGITKAQVEAAKQQGQLYEFLTSKLNAFAEAGERGTQNFTTRLGNLTDILDQVLGKLSTGIFQEIKEGISQITEGISNPAFSNALRSSSEGLQRLVKWFFELGTFGLRHIGLVTAALEVLAVATMALAAHWLAFKAIGVVPMFQGWMVAINGFTASLVGMNPVLATTAGLVGTVGTAFGGWHLGRLLGQLEIFGARIDDVATYHIYNLLESWAYLKNKLGITSDDEFRREKAGIEKSIQDLLSPEQFASRAEGSTGAGVAGSSAGEVFTKEFEKELDGAFESLDKLTLATTAARVSAGESLRTLELEQVKLALEREELLLEESLARRKGILAASRNDAMAALDEQLKFVDAGIKRESGKPGDNAAITRRNELLAQRQALLAQMVAIDAQHDQQVLALEAEVDAERLRRQQEVESARVRMLNESLGQQQQAQDLAAAQYRRRLQEIDLQVQTGAISQREAQRQTSEVAEHYRATLHQTLDLLMQIQGIAPDLAGLETRIEGIRSEILTLPMVEDMSFAGRLKQGMGNLASQFGDLGTNISNTLTNTVQAAVNGLSNALTSLMMGTKTAGQAFSEFGLSLMTTFISNIITAILWAKIAIPLLTYLGIVSGGVTMGPGMAMVGSALAMSAGAAGSISARADGGPVDQGKPYIVGERGPEIFVPNFGGTIIPNIQAPSFTRNAAGGMQPGGSAGQKEIHVVVVDTEAAARRVMEGHIGEKVVLHHFQRNKLNLGISS